MNEVSKQMIELRLASLSSPYHKSHFIPGLLYQKKKKKSLPLSQEGSQANKLREKKNL